jgi:hypothetical protein
VSGEVYGNPGEKREMLPLCREERIGVIPYSDTPTGST